MTQAVTYSSQLYRNVAKTKQKAKALNTTRHQPVASVPKFWRRACAETMHQRKGTSAKKVKAKPAKEDTFELSRHFEFDFLTSIERRVGQSTCLVPRGLETRLIDAMGWQWVRFVVR